MEGLSVQTVISDGDCVFRSVSILLEDERQDNKSRGEKFVVPEGQIIQPTSTVVGESESERSAVCLFYVFSSTTLIH
jgi:hypothetical protein